LEQALFPVSSLAYLFAVLAALVAAAFDLKTGLIPNKLTIPVGLVGLGFAVSAAGLPGWIGAVAGLGVAFVLLLPGFLLGFTGGGDLKLASGLGCFLGPELSLVAGLLYYLAGGLIALGAVLLTARGRRTGPFARYRAMYREWRTSGRLNYLRPAPGEYMGLQLRMAPAIAFATIAAPMVQ
jgi:prepilin peptidase CpaA